MQTKPLAGRAVLEEASAARPRTAKGEQGGTAGPCRAGKARAQGTRSPGGLLAHGAALQPVGHY